MCNDNRSPQGYFGGYEADDKVAARLAPEAGDFPVKLVAARVLLYDFDAAGEVTVRARVYSTTPTNEPGVDLGASQNVVVTSFYPLWAEIDLAAPRGAVVFMGNISSDLHVPRQRVSSVLRKELSLLGTWNSSIAQPLNEWEAVLRMVRDGQLELSPLISHRVSLDELPGLVGRIIRGDEIPWKVIVEFDG